MAAQIGNAYKAYRASADVASTVAATVAAMTWTEMTNVKDVTTGLEAGQADATTRGSTFKTYIAGMLDGSVEFEMIADTADADFTALQTAFFAKDTVPLAFMNGAIATAGNEGFVANFSVVGFTRNEPLEEAVTVSVTLKPSTFPQWFTAPA